LLTVIVICVIIQIMPVLYLRNINEQIKRKFKALCVERGKTLTEEIERLMQKEVEKAAQKG